MLVLLNKPNWPSGKKLCYSTCLLFSFDFNTCIFCCTILLTSLLIKSNSPFTNMFTRRTKKKERNFNLPILLRIFEIEKIMFDFVDNQHLEDLVESIWGIFGYIQYYTVKSFDSLMNEDIDGVLNNRDDYFEILERITSVLLNSSRNTTVVLKIFFFFSQYF